MTNIYTVAKYILLKVDSMTTMKLQKLCYYAQAWTLAWDDEPLFNEDFEAWANGPVCKELFNLHKGQFRVSASNFLQEYSADDLTADEANNIDIVYDYYGDKESYWLSELTHKERPWKDARQKAHALPGDPCSEIITKESMASYYAGL